MTHHNHDKTITETLRYRAEDLFNDLVDDFHGLLQLKRKRPNKKTLKAKALLNLSQILGVPKARMQFRYLTFNELDTAIKSIQNKQEKLFK